MVRIPTEYQEVEYIESTGTQHINTEYLIQSEKIRIVASVITSPSYGEQDLIGNQDSATGRFIIGFYRYYVFLFARDSQGTEQNVISETFPNEASNFIIDAIYDLQNGTKSLTVNGETYSGSHERSIISTAKLKLFQNGQNSNKFVGKTRYLRIYEDSNLLFDFIPCYRKSDNEIGMYDTVTGTFYTNQGTGTFLKGNDVTYDPISLLEIRRRIIFNNRPHLGIGTLTCWLSGKDAPVDNCWVDRINGLKWALENGAVYDSQSKLYDASGDGAVMTLTPNMNLSNLSLGHHWRIVFDMDFAYHNDAQGYFWDFGSVVSANRAIGLGMFLSDNNDFAINWKMEGNSSNPGVNIKNTGLRPSADTNVFHRYVGYFEIVDGGNGFDRFNAFVNNHKFVCETDIPKVSYSPNWDKNANYLGGGYLSSYRKTKVKFRDLRIYVID